MSYFKEIELTDTLQQPGRMTPYNELVVTESVRLVGNAFSGNVIDTNFYTTVVVGSGTVTQVNAQQTLATGITANSSAKSTTIASARYIASSQNRFLARVQMGDTGTVNNVRRWGAFNGTDGAYFKLSGITMNVATMIGGVETAIASGSWNGTSGVPVLTNLNVYEIAYTLGAVRFLINGVLAHIIPFNSAPWTATPHLMAYMDNVNSGGSTTNVTMITREFVITRLGRYNTQGKVARITTAATVVLNLGPGLLHRVILGNPTGTLITVYDNTTAAGTIITIINTPAIANPVTLEYMAPFQIGLTVVSTGSWDATIIYE